MPSLVFAGILSGPAPTMALVKAATSADAGRSRGAVDWVLKSSTEAAAASDGCKRGSLPAPSRHPPALRRALLPFM